MDAPIRTRRKRHAADGSKAAITMRMVLVVLLTMPALPAAKDFARVTGPCGLQFPQDHGAHPAFRTEWWYYTGNVTEAPDRRFGFQLTLFRYRLAPPEAAQSWPAPRSDWRTHQIYMGHLAVSDIDAEKHRHAEITSRGAVDLAGVTTKDDTVTIFVHGWEVRIQPDRHRLEAVGGPIGLALDLRPLKPPVFHGDGGYSQKGSAPEQASCYYSFTRMAAAGSLTVDGTRHPVEGLAWMDHEFSTAPLAPGLAGWDWFSIQLDDGTELMVFFLRSSAGGVHPASSGTFVDASGTPHPLEVSDVTVTPGATWKSPDSGAVYPVAWQLTAPTVGVDLQLSAVMVDQEMDTTRTTGVTYWEGSVSITGTSGGKAVSGRGYVEMTGYAGAFRAPL